MSIQIKSASKSLSIENVDHDGDVMIEIEQQFKTFQGDLLASFYIDKQDAKLIIEHLQKQFGL